MLIVIGAGAAGLLAAGMAARSGAKVVLLEKNDRPGKKLLITGKGRCNLTNIAEIPELIKNMPGNGSFLYSSFHQFDNRNVIRFFEDLGVATKVERGGRVFPVSDKAADVVGALERFVRQSGVEIRYRAPVAAINVATGRVKGVKVTGSGLVAAKAVIITTGGASYPLTGSTGDGQRLAAELGHTIIPLKPALAPLETVPDWSRTLPGVALKNVKAKVKIGKQHYEEFGEMLFTHFGISGPIILTLSRWMAAHFDQSTTPLTLEIDLKPALDTEQLDRRLQRDFQQYVRKQLKNALDELLPQRLIPPVILVSGIAEDKFVHQVTRAERSELVKALKSLPLTVTGMRPLAEAIVTAGGVSVKEIAPRTMASKKVAGLFFAGEVIDIDGFTGGFNLQAAFSTGYVAGLAAADYLISD